MGVGVAAVVRRCRSVSWSWSLLVVVAIVDAMTDVVAVDVGVDIAASGGDDDAVAADDEAADDAGDDDYMGSALLIVIALVMLSFCLSCRFFSGNKAAHSQPTTRLGCLVRQRPSAFRSSLRSLPASTCDSVYGLGFH